MRSVLFPAFVVAVLVSCRDSTPLSPIKQTAFECEAATLRAAPLEKANATLANAECDSGGGEEPEPPNGIPIPIPGILLGGINPSSCFVATAPAATSVDSDGDGVTNACEQTIAAAFAPRMSQWTGEFAGMGMVPGEYYHGVRKLSANSLRVIYMPAYFGDFGFVPGHLFSHPGDSEFIVLDIEREAGDRWLLKKAHFSEHFEDPPPSYDWWQLEFDNYVSRGRPLVYVANRKHANYPTATACDNGGDVNGTDLGNVDTCDGARQWILFPVDPGFNIGSEGHPIGTVAVRRMVDFPFFSPDGRENFWTVGRSFAGWQNVPSSTSGYSNALQRYGFIGTSQGGDLPGCPSDPTALYCP